MLRALVLACGALLVPTFAFAVPMGSAPAASILVLPFSVPAGADGQWIGKAVQQDLMADLSQGTHAIVWAPSSAVAASDDAAALATARERGATLVVYGQAQVAGKELRLTGQVLDVASGRPLGNLKATGPSDGLFHLEDAVAGQVLAALPVAMLEAKAPPQEPPPADEVSAPPAAQPADSGPATTTYTPPQLVDSYPAVTNYSYTYYQPVYNYVYTYPLYARPYYDFYHPCYDFFTPCYPCTTFFLGFDVGRFHEHHHDFVHDRPGWEGRTHEASLPVVRSERRESEESRPTGRRVIIVDRHAADHAAMEREPAARSPQVTYIGSRRGEGSSAAREAADRGSYTSSRSEGGSARMSIGSRSTVSAERSTSARSDSSPPATITRSSDSGASRGGTSQGSSAGHTAAGRR